MKEYLKSISIPSSAKLAEVLRQISKCGVGGVCVKDDGGRVIGTVTDGDIRRFLLNARSGALEFDLRDVMRTNFAFVTVGSQGVSLEDLKNICIQKVLHFVPLLDEQRNLCGIFDGQKIIGYSQPATLVIVAGGKGTRLLPITESIPKCLVGVKGKPILEHYLQTASNHGFSRVLISVNYFQEKVIQFVDEVLDSLNLSLQVDFITEPKPLGSLGGVLGYGDYGNPTVIVTNCDLFPVPNFSAIMREFFEGNWEAALATGKYHIDIPFGVVECGDDVGITSIKEKPRVSFDVLMGVYALSDASLNRCSQMYYDGPDFFVDLAASGVKVGRLDVSDFWLDIGRHDTLEKARSYCSAREKID